MPVAPHSLQPTLTRCRPTWRRGTVGLLAATLLFLTGCGEQAPPTSEEAVEILDLVAEAEFSDLQRRPESPPVQLDSDRRRLLVPAGQRLGLFFRLEGEASLLIDRLRPRGQGPYRILFQRDGEEEVVLGEIERAQQESEFPLPAGESPFVSLSFSSRPGSSADGGLVVVKPRIRQTRPTAPGPAQPAAATSEPNIIIFLVDTLRKDHLGIYGYPVPVSPHIDRFAETATVYDHAIAQSPWTRPSVASILTGLEPHVHSVNDRPDALPQGVLTLAEALRQTGYETAAFITNGNVGSEYHFDQGFDHFSRSERLQHRAHQLNERVLGFLDNRPDPAERPVFLYIHAMEPHAPYQPPEEFRQQFAAEVDDPKYGEIEYLNGYHKRQEMPEASVIERARALYDAEIAFLDQQFGRFLDELRRRGLYENSLIVFVSDHGEEFWEHGDWSHGQSLFGVLLDMPLLVKEPGQQQGRRSDRLVQHTDLFATAMDWAGQPPQTFAQGRSLRAAAPESASVYSKLDMDGRNGVALVFEDWKLIDPRTGNLGFRPQLFHRPTDPGEQRDLWAERPIVGGYLMSRLRRHEAPSALAVAGEEAQASEELIQELEALGYIN